MPCKAFICSGWQFWIGYSHKIKSRHGIAFLTVHSFSVYSIFYTFCSRTGKDHFFQFWGQYAYMSPE